MPIQNEPTGDVETLQRLDRSDQNPLTLALTHSIVEFAADRMAYLVRKQRLYREVSCRVYGQVDEDDDISVAVPKKMIAIDTYEKVRKAARALMRQRSMVGHQQARDESIAYWELLLTNPDVPWAVKARARENVDKIHQVAPADVHLNVVAPVKETVSLADLGLDLESRKKALETLRMRKALVTANAATQAAGEAALARPTPVELI